MNWNPSKHKNIVQAGLCVLLCGAILLGLLLPAMEMTHSQPADPLEDGGIREITVLKVGETAEKLDNILVPGKDGGASSESQETQPEETDPQETKPGETKPQETVPNETEPSDPDHGDDDEGNDDGDEGEEGLDPLELDLAAVMTWYKYGNEPNTLACGPSSAVYKSINTAQLSGNALKYEFTLAGEDARFVQIKNVAVAAGNSAFRETGKKGTVDIELPQGTGDRSYTFRVTAQIEKQGEAGGKVRQELIFTFVLKCEYDLDLEMELTWQPKDSKIRKLLCGPDKTEGFYVRNYEVNERVFGYSVRLTGTLANEAQLIGGSFTTASGQNAGELNINSGTLILDPAPGVDQEVYTLAFTVRISDRTVTYRYKLTYQETLDVQLKFQWMEKGVTQRTKTCEVGSENTIRVKGNQLSAGALAYALTLTGKDGENGRILSVGYTSKVGDSGNLEPNGSLAMSMPEGATSNTYHMTVNAIVNGQRVRFDINLHYSADLTLRMEYSILENGVSVTRQITCENTRSKTAEPIYDDQLTDGLLSYKMSLVGSDEAVAITSVTCYQSGSGRTLSLGGEGQLDLLLKEGKTGENSFEIEAKDSGGNIYRFTVNIPYKHRGENNIKIETNLTDGQEIINETKTNLTVRAWSEDANGKITGYIPANGTDTKLTVMLDGEILTYVSSSGAASEFDLYPSNPQVGDTNTHTLYIYAEDALGNYGELTLTLKGQRRESGQQIGTATIYVDMTALGLGVVANLSYEVLADEPVSYVIAKAIMGQDVGGPFGSTENTLGWNGRYAGTLDNGFYLQSLTTGHTANALEGGTWPGRTETEILAAIDARFGRGTGLATLWRCLYRNGLNKSTGSGNSFGEFDYTSGSGWMYSVGGSTYYPGQSMSSVYLQNGDVLTVRYTLAYGWDVGGGTAGYGSTVGYCVSAVNGTIRVNHRMEAITNGDGSVSNVCRCCGIVEDCAHANAVYRDLEDGTHIRYCQDCKKEIGDPEEHGWVHTGEHSDTSHSCGECGAVEEHSWKEVAGSNTATCTEPGKRSVRCAICNMIKEEDVGPKGHTMDNKWQVTAAEHYSLCSTCGEIANRGRHQYTYVPYTENGVAKETFECTICSAWHVDECNGAVTQTNATCQKITYYCGGCGYSMVQSGAFDAYHRYHEGKCEYCGAEESQG